MRRKILKKLAVLLFGAGLLVGLVLPVSAEVDNAGGGIFAEYVSCPAPKIESVLSSAEEDGICVTKFRFYSLQTDKTNQNIVYAVAAYPAQKGTYPGVMALHGGGQRADLYEKRVKTLAKAGYVAISPELPGIANPETAVNSDGMWRSEAYGERQLMSGDDPKASSIYEAVVAALEGFHLLQEGTFLQEGAGVTVDKTNLGICGVSWGGYTSTMAAGILQNQVKAVFSEYGSGFYDMSSWWTDKLNSLPAPARAAWLDNLDAGRRAQYITADYFAAAAANDDFFYPPAVMATLNEIPGHKNLVLAPNASHNINLPGGTKVGTIGSPDGCSMQYDYFNYVLKGEGAPLPEVTFHSGSFVNDGSDYEVAFSVVPNTENELAATLYYSDSVASWPNREWKAVPAVIKNGICTAQFPVEAGADSYNFYLVVSEDSADRAVSASSRIFSTPVLPPAGKVLAGDYYTAFLNNGGNHDEALNKGAYVQWWNTSWAGYRIRVPESGIYRIKMAGASVSDANKTTLRADNTVVSAEFPFPSTGSDWASVSTEEAIIAESVPLEKGTHYIKFTAVAGGGMNFCYFTYEKTGELSDRESVTVPAVACDLLADEGAGFHDGSPEGLDGAHYNIEYSPIDAQGTVVSFGMNEWMRYYVNAKEAGWFDIVASYSSASKRVRILAAVNNEQTVTGEGEASGSWSSYETVSVGRVYLNEGDNEIKILNAGTADISVFGAFQFSQFTVSKASVLELCAGEKAGMLAARANLSGALDGENVCLIAAVYSESRLTDLYTISREDGDTVLSTELAAPQGGRVKVLLMNTKSLKPYANAVEYTN